MKKRRLYWIFLFLLFAGRTWAQPFANDQQNRWAYQAVADLMQRAGMSDSAVSEFRARKDFTRMEFAMWVNSVMVRIEEQGMAMTPDISEKVEKLSAEFQKEFLLLQLQDAVNENRSLLEQIRSTGTGSGYELEGDFSLYAEKLDGSLPVSQDEEQNFGEAPRHTKVMLAQQIRIKCLAKVASNLKGVLQLRSFGYWGVGRYTSGSTDINFSSADPLQIDLAFISWESPMMKVEAGRRNLCYGPWGLLVDRRYEPLNSLEMVWGKGSEVRMLLASQFSGMDYLSTRFQFGEKRAKIGATAFYTLFSQREQEESGLINEQGIGCDLMVTGAYWQLAAEYGLYNPARTNNIFKGYVPGFVANFGIDFPHHVNSQLNLGTLGEKFLSKSMPLDIIPLEFSPGEYHQFIPGTMGLRWVEEVILRNVSIRTDLVSLVKHNGTHHYNRINGSLKWGVDGKMDIIIEDSYFRARDYKYNQIGAMLKLKF